MDDHQSPQHDDGAGLSPRRTHEIIEEYCRAVYRTNREAGRDAAFAVPRPLEAFKVRSGFVSALREFTEVLGVVVAYLDEQEARRDDGVYRGHMQTLKAELSDCRLALEHMEHINPLKPNIELAPGTDPLWEPTGYVGIALSRNSILAGTVRWLALRWPACANELRDALARLLSAAELAEEPLEPEGATGGEDQAFGQPNRGGGPAKVGGIPLEEANERFKILMAKEFYCGLPKGHEHRKTRREVADHYGIDFRKGANGKASLHATEEWVRKGEPKKYYPQFKASPEGREWLDTLRKKSLEEAEPSKVSRIRCLDGVAEEI